MAKGSTIGELNGKWALMFKLGQFVIPIIVAALTWLGTEVYAIQKSRFTEEDGEALKARVRTIERDTPTQAWLQSRMDRLDDSIKAVGRKIDRHVEDRHGS